MKKHQKENQKNSNQELTLNQSAINQQKIEKQSAPDQQPLQQQDTTQQEIQKINPFINQSESSIRQQILIIRSKYLKIFQQIDKSQKETQNKLQKMKNDRARKPFKGIFKYLKQSMGFSSDQSDQKIVYKKTISEQTPLFQNSHSIMFKQVQSQKSSLLQQELNTYESNCSFFSQKEN